MSAFRIQILLITFLIPSFGLSMSASRDPSRNYTDYIQAYGLDLNTEQSNKTASQSRKTLEQLDFSNLPNYRSFEVAYAMYRSLRDTAFLQDPDHAGFKRRSSWLYPHDGCFARAQLMVENISQLGLQIPKKLFIFGNLSVQTEYAKSKSVSWWYHVVPIARVGNHVIVFDPSIEFNHPLFLKDWIKKQSITVNSLKDTKFSICHGNSYTPSSVCNKDNLRATEIALKHQSRYLIQERRNLEALGKSPRLIGDRPPWYFSL